MNILGLFAAVLASATALAIAIFVYPYQKQKDREFQIHQERRHLYREFLKQLEAVSIMAKVNSNWFREDEFRRLDALFGEVQLLSGSDVKDKAEKVMIAVNTKFMSDDGDVLSDDGKTRSLYANILFERDRLVSSMRKELIDH